MTTDEPADDHDAERTDDTGADEGIGIDVSSEDGESGVGARERLEREADRAVSEFDEGLVDLLAWLLDTETRARIYVYLRQQPGSTSEEVANGTGLYPSTVREALADLHDEGTVTRRKREHDGAGNNPYEYTAIAPSDLVRNVAEQVQSELNTVFNLDNRLGGDDEAASGGDEAPVSITVDEKHTAEDADDAGAADDDHDNSAA
ncbi:winged helix-turn-helix domain-containing protein [Halobellus ruber]|uniref:Winged helix-turn-helix transcriptional regulator n=1 Tax=Halobellus ruber TaxID=2761102 RepID=A0A7J9SLV4_9EURY|nr:winged helix-turn-helix domain-containing protein [Halobellus ruber]MBB6647512.1 winged helix-turn-helix transcriptional regulator [Halobellus ruber]